MLWTIFIAARDGDAVVVPAGTDHDLVNMSNTALLKLYTIYSPPNHSDGTVYETKPETAESPLKHSLLQRPTFPGWRGTHESSA